MEYKKLLSVILLAVVLCFVSGAGYGEVQEWMDKEEVSFMDISLLQARIDYIMQRPNDFMNVVLYYDPSGIIGREVFAGNIDTEGKIIVRIEDTRDFFAGQPELLIIPFALELNSIYKLSSLGSVATDRDSDIVAIFYREGKELGYFSEGEYYLWEELK